MINVLNKLKNVKHKEIIIAVVAVIIMLIIYFSSFGSSTKKQQIAADTDYCSMMQTRLKDLISEIDGVGRADVIISWTGGVETLTQNSANGNSKKEIYPRAIGVIIVCEGGSNAKVKIDIIMAVSTLMDISAEKVLVYEKKK